MVNLFLPKHYHQYTTTDLLFQSTYSSGMPVSLANFCLAEVTIQFRRR